jgi:hypothetical protein
MCLSVCPSAVFVLTSWLIWTKTRFEYHHHHHPSRYRPTARSGSEVYFWTYESIWTIGRTPWTGDQPDARPLPAQDNTTQKKRGHTSMPRAGFEPAIPIFDRPNTVRALDRAAIGIIGISKLKFIGWNCNCHDWSILLHIRTHPSSCLV